MFHRLSNTEFNTLAERHQRVLVFKEIMGDEITPVQAFQALKSKMAGATLLESSIAEKTEGRYSFIGFTPEAELKVKAHNIHIEDREGKRTIQGNVLAALRDFYAKNRAGTLRPMPGFAGGIVGFFAYEAARLFEKKLQREDTENDFPDMVLKSYQDHMIFDQQNGKIIFATILNINRQDETQYENAMSRLNDIHESIMSIRHHDIDSQLYTDEAPSHEALTRVDDEAFIRLGKIAQSHIQAGDAFQIVLARTFEQNFRAKPFDIYRVLRLRNPSPYMFYIDNQDYIICGASPEKMITVKNNQAEVCPLAGTRPRGEGYDDGVQQADLLSDPKEVAEHMMLVDLARNDVGAVAKPGQVTVSALKQIKQFSHVMHLSSTVTAPLADHKDALDALCASFPAGTLSGAPKIRAMEIIDTLEDESRQLYGGAIGFLDSQGDFDSCIAIRMAVLKQGTAYVTAGAGITAESDLQKEADETRHKARAVLEAIALAEGGLA